MSHSATQDAPRVEDDREPTIGKLFSDASRDLSGLVRDEIELAKAELRDDVKAGIKGGGMFAAAALLGIMAGILLTFALVYLLVALGLNEAVSFLIVAVVFLAVAGALAFVGLKQVKKIGPPERAIATTKETVTVLKSARSA